MDTGSDALFALWAARGVRAAIIVAAGLVLFLALRVGIRRFEALITAKDAIRESESTLRLKTLSKLANWLGGIAIALVIVYAVLQGFGIDVAPLLAGAGIVGLAFGFGGQYLIRDLINGIFILLEGQYRVNDVVQIGEHGGLVEDVNLRVTTLRDLEGRVIIIPNGEIKTVVNFTKGYAQALLKVGVAYKENVDRVMEVIREIGKEMRKDPHFGRLILEDLEMLGVDDLGDSQVTILFRLKTLPIKQWDVAREFRRRLKNRFDALGIEIPFPHRTLYLGAGKDNDWLRALAERQAVR
jgi:small conductance mechanosensitive channel